METWNAPDCSAAMPSRTSGAAAVDQARELGAVLLRLARNLVVVGFVGLAEIRGVRVGNRALRAHPMQRGARVEAAGKRDADFLADRKRLKNRRHGGDHIPAEGRKLGMLVL